MDPIKLNLSDDAPAVSVVICTHNRGQELERCLRGVSRQNYPSFDVFVIDSAPQNTRAVEIAHRWGASYAVVREKGLSRARNLGMRVSTGAIVVFLDDDSVPHPEWLLRLAAEFVDPQVAVVTGRLQELRTGDAPSGDEGESFSLDSLGDRRRAIDRGNPQWFEIANFGGVGQGSNMAFRRSALQWWSGFDHRLGRGTRISGSEEHYAFFQIIARGARAVYTPEAVVYHPYPANPEALREHELRRLAASTGYLTFLFFEVAHVEATHLEATHHRKRLVRYVLEALRGVRRTWRATRPQPVRLVSRRASISAMLAGPALYFKTLFVEQREFGADAQAVAAPRLSTRLRMIQTGDAASASGRAPR